MTNRTVALPDGTRIPAIGQGTWYMGDDPARRATEVETLRTGAACGMTLIDTAEMYGEGAAETLVGAAIAPLERDELFLVSKVYPHNAGRDRIFDSCRASLERLGVETLDLYLLHWRGDVPLAETVACMEQLQADELIRRWGVSNFDVADMEELMAVPGGDACAVNQVLYHLGSRGIEFDLLPWQDAHGIPVMAYCPLAQGGRLSAGLLRDEAVAAVASRHDATPAQVLLAFVIRSGTVVAIPKASTPAHARDNAAALELRLTDDDLALLDQRFPAPDRKMPLDME